MRAWVGDFDRPMRAAKAVALMRPSASKTDRMAWSKASSGSIGMLIPFFQVNRLRYPPLTGQFYT